MWKQLIDLIPKIFTLMQRVEIQEKALQQQQTALKELSQVVQGLVQEQQRMRDEARHQAERQAYEFKLLLQEIEIQYLKGKLQFPPQSKEKPDNQDT